MANVIVHDIGQLLQLVGDVATQDPISGFLVVMSLIVWVIAFGVFGYLAVGGILSALVPETTTPRREGR